MEREEWIPEGISTKKGSRLPFIHDNRSLAKRRFYCIQMECGEKDKVGEDANMVKGGQLLIWKREADPNIPVGLDGESYGDLLYNMLEYENIYFSRNAFAAKLYVGENGLFLLFPTSASDLPRDEKEKTRLKKALVEIKEALGLEALEELDSMQTVSKTEEIPDEELAELSVLGSFDKDRLKALIDKVIVYGEDAIEIVWKVGNPFEAEITA